MNADQYLKERVEDQIGWYDRRSQRHQRWYKALRLGEIVAAATIPILIAYSTQKGWVPLTVAVLGGGVSVIAAVLGLYQFEQHWIEFRTTCESLKKEKFLFLTGATPYTGDEVARFQLLVQRVETLVSKENTNWAQYMMKPREEG